MQEKTITCILRGRIKGTTSAVFCHTASEGGTFVPCNTFYAPMHVISYLWHGRECCTQNIALGTGSREQYRTSRSYANTDPQFITDVLRPVQAIFEKMYNILVSNRTRIEMYPNAEHVCPNCTGAGMCLQCNNPCP